MEETKLDRAVDKIFRFTEKFVNKFSFVMRSVSRSVYFDLFRLIFGLSYCGLLIAVAMRRGSFNFFTDINSLYALFLAGQSCSSLKTRYDKLNDIDLKFLNFTRKYYSDETVKFCFEPLIADWKQERKIALASGKTWRADFITIRYVWAFFVAALKQTWLGRLLEIIGK